MAFDHCACVGRSGAQRVILDAGPVVSGEGAVGVASKGHAVAAGTMGWTWEGVRSGNLSC